VDPDLLEPVRQMDLLRLKEELRRGLLALAQLQMDLVGLQAVASRKDRLQEEEQP